MKNEHDHKEDSFDEELPEGVVLRDHVIDGIREYDQRLPKWWLVILFSAITFSIIYWVVIDDRRYKGGIDPALEVELAKLATKKLSSSIDVTNNEMFYEMAKNPSFASAGQETFEANCIACHGKDLKGGIGFNLVDETWVHGAYPSDIYQSIAGGFPDKGMQPWEPLLGQKRIAEVIAYIISKNDLDAMKAAQESGPAPALETPATPEATSSDSEPLALGEAVYQQNCRSCHGSDRKGVAHLGSDLTDGVWAYGGSREEVIKTIRDGILKKGMLAWGPILSDEEIEAVADYIMQ